MFNTNSIERYQKTIDLKLEEMRTDTDHKLSKVVDVNALKNDVSTYVLKSELLSRRFLDEQHSWKGKADLLAVQTEEKCLDSTRSQIKQLST